MQKMRLRLLHVAPAYYPATYWGGPTISVHELCRSLAGAGMDLRVITTDTAGPARSQRVPVSSFPMTYEPGYEVYFCRRWFGADIAPSLIPRLARLIREADVIHLTGVYSFPTIPTLVLCRLFGKPVVWSPRGALQRWENASKPRLKRLYDRICDLIVSRRICSLHATSEREASDSRLRIKNSTTTVIPNGVEIPAALPNRFWTPNAALRLLYMGRLHPVKGIENLLVAIDKLDDASISLSICGTGDSVYFESLRDLVSSMRLQDRVRFLGHVEGEEKTAAFMNADACIVPSYTENFGMVVAESLAHAVPVVVSRAPPWSEIELRGCGLWTENSPESLAVAIRRIRMMDLAAMGGRGRSWMRESFSWRDVARRMIGVYDEAILRAR